MSLSYKHLLPSDFNPRSRVWVYQSNRMLSLSEALRAEEHIDSFIANWQSHGDPVKGFGNLFFGQFVILMADESDASVSGCSTDSSVSLIRKLETEFNINLLDRQMLAFVVRDKVELLPMSQLLYAIENRFITPDTLYFNNLVHTKEQLENNWIIPIKNSWVAKKFSTTSL